MREGDKLEMKLDREKGEEETENTYEGGNILYNAE